jgi:hypothetical protein
MVVLTANHLPVNERFTLATALSEVSPRHYYSNALARQRGWSYQTILGGAGGPLVIMTPNEIRNEIRMNKANYDLHRSALLLLPPAAGVLV